MLDHLDWPFLDGAHRELAEAAHVFAAEAVAGIAHDDVDAACRSWVSALGNAGFLRQCVPAAHGGARERLDSRALCVMREALAFHDGLADFAFAMQGLGSGAITLAGNEAQRARWLPGVAGGGLIAAFALSEPDAGSDVGAMTCAAARRGDGYRLDGTKTWISNGGIADFYTVFARTGEAPGTGGISAFVVPANTPGLQVTRRIEVMAPHPLATLQFDDCLVPEGALLGEPGQGFKLAMATLDIFRASVGAAAVGFARRALAEAVRHARGRRMFGQTLADLQITQAKFGEMATAIDAAALLTYRAAWTRDVRGLRATGEAAMAKMAATESAQRVVDAALQMFGGRGVVQGEIAERLYREIRALRIYEGATEVQKLIVARELLRAADGTWCGERS